ncbi:MAG: hypothetical protein U0411_02120 [Thermodesulfovibrionales bacterium]
MQVRRPRRRALREITEGGLPVPRLHRRGDGYVGEDITTNSMNQPDRYGGPPAELLFLEGRAVPERIDIRGEVYMHIREFEALNRERGGEEGGAASPRQPA